MKRRRGKLVGITGSFCTGKTFVAGLFRKLGAVSVDSDAIVHSLYKKNRKVKKAVFKIFGNGVFTGNQIDRRKLAGRVFRDKKSLKRLCGVIHPAVIKEIIRRSAGARGRVVVAEVPLLIEARLSGFFDSIVVVAASRKKQIKRCKNKGFSKKDFTERIRLQMPIRKKAKYADFLINNNGTKNATEKRVRAVWQELIRR